MTKKAVKKEEIKKEEPKVEQKHVCDVCGNDVVAKESDGHYYCYDHHMLWTKCYTHERMVKENEK